MATSDPKSIRKQRNGKCRAPAKCNSEPGPQTLHAFARATHRLCASLCTSLLHSCGARTCCLTRSVVLQPFLLPTCPPLVRKTLARWQRARQSTATSTTQRAQDLARTGSAIIHDHGWSSVNLAWMPGGPRNATPASHTCARGPARMRPRNLTKREFARANDGQITSDFAQRAADTPFNARNFRAWRRGSSVGRTYTALQAVAPQLVRRHPRHAPARPAQHRL